MTQFILGNCKKHGKNVKRKRVCSKNRGTYTACIFCLRDNCKNYRKNNRLKHLFRKTKTRKWKCSLTFGQLETIVKRQNNICALSGIPFDNDFSIDRIDSTKGYTEDNVQLVITDINRMKRDLPQDKFITYCKEIARNNGCLN